MANKPQQMFLSPTVINALGLQKDKPDEGLLPSVYNKPYKELVQPADRWGYSTSVTPIDVYRTNTKTKKPETLPHKYDIADYQHVVRSTVPVFSGKDTTRQIIDPATFHALHDAMRLNPNLKVSPQEMVTLLAQEGRTDFGANDIAPENYAHNPQATAMYKRLMNMGYSEEAAGLPALLLDKQMIARRLNVPWQQAWNGMGTVSWSGRTGADYAKEIGMNANNIGVNKNAVNAVQQYMQEPKNIASLSEINMQDWIRRQQSVEDMRKAEMNTINSLNPVERYWNYPKLLVGRTPEQYAQERYPDAPIPFPDDPNAATESRQNRLDTFDWTNKAKGGSIESANPKAGRKRDI